LSLDQVNLLLVQVFKLQQAVNQWFHGRKAAKRPLAALAKWQKTGYRLPATGVQGGLGKQPSAAHHPQPFMKP
jgi:hypothetical protein